MRFPTAVACVASLIAAGLALSDDPALARQALDRMETASADEWAFTETTVENGSTVVRNHDPSRPDGQRWTVVSVDGRTPGESAGESDVKLDGPGSDGESGDEDGESVGAMITPDTLTLLEESATHAIYSFQPAGEDEDDEKMMAHVDGTLQVNKNGPYVESIELRNRKPFSAAFGVKLKEFVTRLTFAPVGPQGVPLPRTVHVRLAGRAFLVKKLDETVEVTYSDYRQPGD